MEEQLPRKFGKYTLLRKLAVGGMAEIYLALHRSISGFEKLLVIKRILPNLTKDQEFLRMFLDEARIAATLNHPNIAQIYDVGNINEDYFIAMEYVNGEDLRSIVRGMKKKSVSSFPLEHALQIIVGMCSGLEFAHSRTDFQGAPLDIVHRDISPQNVLVTFAGDIKVVDFGIARAKMAGIEHYTDRGQLKGKVPYMSPEQCRGDSLDRRSDIFSLGILLFELTTMRRLFRSASDFNTLRMIVEEEYPRPSMVVEEYPPELERIVMKSLEKELPQRYQTARELQADLEEFIRQNRIASSSINLSKFMEEIFAEKLAVHREALAKGKRLADIIAEEEQLPDASMSIELGSDGHPISGSGSVSLTPGQSTASWVEKKRLSGSARLAMILVALVLIFGVGGAIVFFPPTGGSATENAVSTGQIQVASHPPGADITLDGEATKAKTPHLFENLRTGRTYQFKLVMDGYRNEIREVKLSAQHPNERLSLELRPTGTGIFVIKTKPAGAKVYIDGREHKSPTPATIPEISPNEEHTVLVKLDDYVDVSKSVSVAPGKVQELLFELQETPLGPDECFIDIQSNPPGASISINGSKLSQSTPYKIRHASGKRVTVELYKKGYMPFRDKIRLASGKIINISPDLERDRRRGNPGQSGPTKPPPPTGFGFLTFNSRPFCNVTIGGKSYGPTPVVNAKLPAGRQRIVCQSPPIGVTKTVIVNIPPDGRVRRSIKLEP